MARKCSLPKRPPVDEQADALSATIPPGISQRESNLFSLRSFLYDFCIPAHSSVSHGYLSTFEDTVRKLGFESDLAKACEAVAFACGGRRLNRPGLSRKADFFHHESVGSLARKIEQSSNAGNHEQLFSVYLLGLYQVCCGGQDRMTLKRIGPARSWRRRTRG
jgi:hypothetical protein